MINGKPRPLVILYWTDLQGYHNRCASMLSNLSFLIYSFLNRFYVSFLCWPHIIFPSSLFSCVSSQLAFCIICLVFTHIFCWCFLLVCFIFSYFLDDMLIFILVFIFIPVFAPLFLLIGKLFNRACPTINSDPQAPRTILNLLLFLLTLEPIMPVTIAS